MDIDGRKINVWKLNKITCFDVIDTLNNRAIHSNIRKNEVIELINALLEVTDFKERIVKDVEIKEIVKGYKFATV